MNNAEIALHFDELGDLYELDGAIVHRVVAYRNAAKAIRESSASIAEMSSILVAVRAARAVGDVAVACMGGVGRTGTVAACALVEAGLDPDEAVAEVRRVRHPAAVETKVQLAFVREYWRDRTGAHAESSDTVSP